MKVSISSRWSDCENIQVGVLAKTFFNSTEAQFSCEIDLRRKELVDTNSPRLYSDNIGHLLDKLWVEGTSHADGGVEDGAIEDQNAMQTFALDKGRDT